jgi:serine phosphatase RsbU (regulator of sigma subunit)
LHDGDYFNLESIATGALWFTNDYTAREHGESNMFVTMFYGLLEPNTGTLAYVNAGHNPPLIMSITDGSVFELGGESTALPIGIIEGQTYEAVQTTLEVGDTLVAFSDGVTEAMNTAGEPYGDERFVAFLKQYINADAEELVAKVVETIDEYAGEAPQADDITLLIARRIS